MTDSPHDKLFKEAFANPVNAIAQLRSVLPSALLARLDLESLTPVPGTFVDEELRASESDLLFSVKVAGENALLYLLFEHKSAVDRWVAWQLLRYIVRIWEGCVARRPRPDYLPPIVPLVVHHSEGRWSVPTQFEALLDPIVQQVPELARLNPRFEFLVDDVGRLSDEELRQRPLDPFGLLTLLFLRDGRSAGRLYAGMGRWADLLRELTETAEGKRALALLLRYIAVVAEYVDFDVLRRSVTEAAPQAEETIMTLAEQLMQRGLQKGREEGREEGRLEGERRVLERLVVARFGQLGEAARQRLAHADQAALDRLTQRLLSATSVEELLAD